MISDTWIEVELEEVFRCRVVGADSGSLECGVVSQGELRETLYAFLDRCKDVPVEGIVFRYSPSGRMSYSSLRSAWVTIHGAALVRGIPCAAVTHQLPLDIYGVRTLLAGDASSDGILYARNPVII